MSEPSSMGARYRSLPKTRRRVRTSGRTLFERSVIFALIAVPLAVIIPSFIKNLRTSRIAEAPSMLEEIAGAAQSYYEARHEGLEGTSRTRCLPESTGLHPEQPSAERREVLFVDETSPGSASWAALGFGEARTLRYSYEVIFPTSGCDVRVQEGRPLFTVRAEGDLDGDGTRSVFERSVTIEAESGEVVPMGILYVTRRTE